MDLDSQIIIKILFNCRSGYGMISDGLAYHQASLHLQKEKLQLIIFTWLYLARRSDLQGAPVLIWPCFAVRDLSNNHQGIKDNLKDSICIHMNNDLQKLQLMF